MGLNILFLAVEGNPSTPLSSPAPSEQLAVTDSLTPVTEFVLPSFNNGLSEPGNTSDVDYRAGNKHAKHTELALSLVCPCTLLTCKHVVGIDGLLLTAF